MRTVNVTNTITEVAPKTEKFHRRWITIQNTSDTDIAICYDDSEGLTTTLTMDNGIILKPGVILTLSSGEDTEEGSNRVVAIHGSAGNKVLRIQEGS